MHHGTRRSVWASRSSTHFALTVAQKREVLTTERPDPDRKRIVVGVDGSESSKAALRWAARLTPVISGDIEAVISWEYPVNYGWAGLIPADWRPDVDARKILEQTLDDVFGADGPPNVVTKVCEGRASYVLLETSVDADLLIVGNRGHGGFVGLLLGSVSAACSEHAKCPVLVVHGTGR